MFWTFRACVRLGTSGDVHVILLEPTYASRVLTPQKAWTQYTPSIYLTGRRTIIGSYDQRRIRHRNTLVIEENRDYLPDVYLYIWQRWAWQHISQPESAGAVARAVAHLPPMMLQCFELDVSTPQTRRAESTDCVGWSPILVARLGVQGSKMASFRLQAQPQTSACHSLCHTRCIKAITKANSGGHRYVSTHPSARR